MEHKWNWQHSAFVIILSLALVGYARFPFLLDKNDASTNVSTWIIMAALLILFMFVLGDGISGRPLGILIDQRNRMSLSRFQMILWTIVVLSGWITAAIW